MEESFPREVPFDSLPELGLTQTTCGFMDAKLMGRWKEAPNARSGFQDIVLRASSETIYLGTGQQPKFFGQMFFS